MKKIPYRATTATGDVFDIDFPLHEETVDPVRVSQMVSAVLAALDRDIRLGGGETANGDVLQALAMALAVRAGIIHAPTAATAALARDLLGTALDAVAAAPRSSPTAGNA